MRIGVIVYGLDRALGGIGRYTEELVKELIQIGTTIVQFQTAGVSSFPGSIDLVGARLLPGLLTLGQIEIAWLAKKHHLDLVHDPTGTVPLSLVTGHRVATIHDVAPYVVPQTSTNLDWLVYRVWLPLAVRRLDALITDSQHSRQDIIRHLPIEPAKVFVVPCAASAHYRVLGMETIAPILRRYSIDFPYILYVGSVTARKNLSRLLEAYARLCAWSSRWQLVVVGARKWKSSPILKTVEQLDLIQRVHFLGFVEDEDLPALYNGADLFVFPSLYEGFGLPVLESMACGTPVVTSNVSSLPEVAAEAAITVDPTDIEALVEAMQRALCDRDLADYLRQRGLERAAEFTWERSARETLRVYNKVLL